MSDITVERQPPEQAFALLGNETRVGILQALAESPDDPVGFSELRERVGMRDSGQFNYHLGKLVGTFVKNGEEGYELSIAGQQVVGALAAGTYTADATLAPLELDDPCPSCGEGPLVVSFADEQVEMRCEACEEWLNQFSFPPGTLDQYTPEELPMAFDRWLRVQFNRIAAGFCSNCAGRLAGRLDPDADDPMGGRIFWDCERCGQQARASAATPVVYHPATAGFLYDHGRDVTSDPSWRLFGRGDVTVTLDPDRERVHVSLTLAGDTLTAVVGSHGTVQSVERSDR
jgi:DNA-binding transcriptional ArsR family regulator